MPAFDRVTVYFEYHSLPPEYQPAQVRRDDGRTLVWVDGRASGVDVLLWSQENLTIAERNYVRAACGQPPVGQHLADDQITDGPCAEAWREVPVMQVPRQLLRSA